MNNGKKLLIGIALLLFNIAYSSYALKVAKVYTGKVISLKSVREDIMLLTAEIESKKTVAVKGTRTNIRWDRIIFGKEE